ncbi:uncharacterized protein LOC132631448 [Lycium barbarum]|uniref:uncharacterized protein LOC132631448 n=1 Tax=Lycium barbarum TaxID=112863 RepID=UPI00293EAC93|nr:uncharacterized protein LOC132631448 [Lycium barbarum]
MSIEDVFPKQAGMTRKIFKAKDTVAAAGYRFDDLVSMTSFSIKKMYAALRVDFPKVQWRRMVCNNLGSPKWTFHLTLVAHRSLYTRDRLAKWGMTNDTSCPLCDAADETIEHLFFLCNFSSQLWKKLLTGQHIQRHVMGCNQELYWAIRKAKANTYIMVLVGCVYQDWQDRNLRVF